MAEVGETIPDFTLAGTQGEEIKEFTLSEFAAGRPVVLVFYVYDFSPVCATQMCEVNDMEFLTLNDDVGVLGISTDGPYSHQRFIEANDLSYPLLTDEDREVYELCGMVEEDADGRKQSKRGILLVDPERTVRYRWEAEDNWDAWTMTPLKEAKRIADEFV